MNKITNKLASQIIVRQEPKVDCCRICMCRKKGMRNIFDDKHVVEDILFCTGVKFTKEDGVPVYICQKCTSHISIACRLKTNCVGISKLMGAIMPATTEACDDDCIIIERPVPVVTIEDEEDEGASDVSAALPPSSEDPTFQAGGYNNNVRSKRSRKRKREDDSWSLVQKYSTAAQAQQAINEENTWSVDVEYTVSKKRETYYTCTKKRDRQQCEARRCLIYDSKGVFMYRTEAIHDHDDGLIIEPVKKEINRLHKLNYTPEAIMLELKKMTVEIPNETQLKNYLSYNSYSANFKRVKNWAEENTVIPNNSSYRISSEMLRQWAAENSVIPNDPSQAFVAGYEISETNFCFVLTTKRLLEIASDSDVLQGGGSYKLTWQGFPVYVIGTTDKQLKFHPLCLVVSSIEDKGVFQLLFRSMKYIMKLLFSTDYNPKILVADADENIQSSCTEEFRDVTVRTCWHHAVTQIKSKMHDVLPKKLLKKIITDLEFLHSITSKNDFAVACRLFLKRYKEHSIFIDYFKDEWLVKYPNWYLGATFTPPAKNVNLNVFLRDLKKTGKIGARLPQATFVQVIKNVLKDWSLSYVDGVPNIVAESPIISLHDWSQALSWARLPLDISIVGCDENFTFYRVPGKSPNSKMAANDWDDFWNNFYSSWEVIVPNSSMGWVKGRCTCPANFRNGMCMHLIGMAIRLGLASLSTLNT